MAFVPKSVLRALDQLDSALTEVESAREEIKHSDISLALTIAGLIVLLKKTRGEEADEALKEFEKCTRAQERLTAPPPAKEEKAQKEASSNKKQKLQQPTQKKQQHRLSLTTSKKKM